MLNGQYGLSADFCWLAFGDKNGIRVDTAVDERECFKQHVYLDIAKKYNWDLSCFEGLSFREQRMLKRHGYTTPLLDVIDESIKKYWLEYDHGNPPLQKVITQELQENYKGVVNSRKMAECIAQIICPINEKRVGRRKIQRK